MTITKEIRLTQFEFWSGAKQFAEKLTYTELNELEGYIEDSISENFTETYINDLFWFEDEMICRWLGLDINEVYNR
tara:strand:+ start:54 stop:281 length:228 start_codon:yes stop_codon:yes gene_type:complete